MPPVLKVSNCNETALQSGTDRVRPETSQFVDSLTALNRASRQFISERYSEQNRLSESAAVLLKLLAGGSVEHWTQTELAQEMCLSESSLCTLIERLRRDQLVHRERLIADRRKTRVVLTPEGMSSAEQIMLTDSSIEHSLQQFLSQEEMNTLLNGLQSLLQACKKSQIKGGISGRAA